MFLLMLLLAGLRGLLASGPGSQNSFLQIIVPEKIQENPSDNSEPETEWISYIITIEEKLYTIHLKQRIFLAHNFMVYVYNQGFVSSYPSDIQSRCYYQGYVEGYPNSVVTLSTCSGLRGILQFENVSYGIEPLESAVEFQHLIYKLRNGNSEFSDFTEGGRSIEQNPVDNNIFISEKSKSTIPDLIPLYLEMHIVVDKALYDYLGSESMIVTNKIIEVIGLVNAMFAQFKVTIVLSSLELWSDNNKISTAGDADEVLHRFLEWKKSYLTLRPHDIAYLFIYRNYPDHVGASVPGKMCVTPYSAGIVMQCGPQSCCNFRTCRLKPTAQCDKGLCCTNCQIERQGVECRKAAHSECDIPEFCNGSSPECQPDITIHNGHVCKQKFLCYSGDCHDTDALCEVTFGKGSKNAPFACYEEIHSHGDSFGNCGIVRGRIQYCGWRNLQCGRLICTYPTRVPFHKENVAVIYAFVRDNLCITIDYRLPNINEDPMKISNGSDCDEGRICVGGQCVESRAIKSESAVCSEKCRGHGVCNSNKTCHCFEGYQPPNCETSTREASSLPEKQGLTMERAPRKAEKNPWLIGFYMASPVLIVATIMAIVSWNWKKWLTKEEESLSVESKSQESTQTHNSSD
uniref:ADAM metallopeptidase domain 32 n=1 Tax=Suricata suricatta TaxID=37032 RepID=A0A673SSN6_SURSU